MGSGANQGILDGIADLEGMRERVLSHVRKSKTAGLGDERVAHAAPAAGGWTREHVAILRDIRDEARALRV
jgi:hypothetical protein